MRRKIIGFLLIMGLLAGSAYATYRWTIPQDVSPPFEQDKFIELQIVSAPVRNVRGQQEYTQDELRSVGYTVYPEEQVRVISTQILRVFNTGESQEFQGRADAIEMVGSWSGSRVRPDGRAGLVLDDFQFSFPSTSWKISPSARLMGLWFAPSRTTLGREFATVTMIHYEGDANAKTNDDSADTFLRVRWLPEPPEATVVELYDSEEAELNPSADTR